MQLGIRLHDIKKAPLPERLKIAEEQGFACGHLALSKVISEYPVDDGALTPGYALYLKRLFEKYHLDIAVLGCYLNLANPNPESGIWRTSVLRPCWEWESSGRRPER